MALCNLLPRRSPANESLVAVLPGFCRSVVPPMVTRQSPGVGSASKQSGRSSSFTTGPSTIKMSRIDGRDACS